MANAAVGWMNPRRAKGFLIIAFCIVLAGALGFWVSSLSENHLLVFSALVVGGVFAISAFLRPDIGFYTLVVSSMFNRYEIPIGEVSVRADQIVLVPIMAGVMLRLAADRLSFHSRGKAIAVLVGLGLYIVLNALSSSLFSPQPVQSFEIVAWLSLSFAALLTTYFVVGRYISFQKAFYTILGVSFVSGAVGIVFFALFHLTGSTINIQRDPITGYHSATGTFFEANIFGSWQVFSAVAGIALLNSRILKRRAYRWIAVGTGASSLALALSFTRAAWLGFFAGILILLFLQLWRGGSLALLVRISALAFIVLTILAPTGLLTNLAARAASITEFNGGTIAYRLDRFESAATEWQTSQLLGLGTNSYGQRHYNIYTNDPETIANIFFTTLYETGVIGLAALIIAFSVFCFALVTVTLKDKTERGALALALLVGFISLLVSYQATNAWWFSYNWIVIAVGIKIYEGKRRITH